MEDIECPYCGHEEDLCHDDGAFYKEDELEENQCSECEKYYMVSTYVTFTHTGYKAPCMNGGEHKWKQINGCPKEYFHETYRCEYCKEEKCFDKEGRKKQMGKYMDSLGN